MKVVVTGAIGSGKSTAVRAALKPLGWERPAGFFTHWDGEARGADVLWAETWTGQKQVLARRRAAPAVPGGIPYELDPRFAPFAAASFAAGPVVVDELGLVELDSPEFAAAVVRLFRGPAPVLAVVQRRALARWLELVGRENVDRLLDVAAAPRGAWPERIAAPFRV